MTKDEAIAQIKQLLSFRTDLATSVPVTLAHAQAKMEDEWPRPDIYPFFLKTEEATSATVASEQRVPLPTGWLADWEEGGLYITDSAGAEHELIKNDYDALKTAYREYDPTLPASFATDGLYYRLFPTPDAVYPLRQIFYKRDTGIASLAGSGTNKWLTHSPWILIGKTAVLLGIGLTHKNLTLAQGMMNDSLKALIERSIWIQTTNRQYAMGETL